MWKNTPLMLRKWNNEASESALADSKGRAIIGSPFSVEGQQVVTNSVLSPGKRAPAFTLQSDKGERVRLTEHRGRWVVLFFFPKALSPTCRREVLDFQAAATEFQKLGAMVLGVCPNPLERLSQFRKDCRLGFPLLHDRDAKLAIKYGVYRERKSSARDYFGIVRSTFLIDPSGRIAHLWDNLRVKGHVARVMKRLQEEHQN